MSEIILSSLIITILVVSFFRERVYLNQIQELTNKLMSRDYQAYVYANNQTKDGAVKSLKKTQVPEEDLEFPETLNMFI